MQLDHLLDVVTLGNIIGLLTAIGAVWAAIKRVKPALSPVLSQLVHFLVDWNGEPERPGVKRRPGVMEQLSELRTDVDMAKTLARAAAESAADASYHSKPNHGDSAYDALIRRVDGLEAANAKTVQVVQDALGEHSRMQERADEQSEIIRAVVARLDTSGEQ